MRAVQKTVARAFAHAHRRYYAKRVSKAILLPQGLQSSLPPLPSPKSPKGRIAAEAEDSPLVSDGRPPLQYSAVLQGALDNIQKYPECVLLTRVGGFYELYFKHAEELHQALGLKRSFKDTKLGPVAMAGFPFFQLDRYLKLLVSDMGRHVAISEEFTRDAGPGGRGPVDLNNKNMFDRRVSRIITPGTLIDEKFMEPEQNNYLLAVHLPDVGEAGLAWTDLSTGVFMTQQIERASLVSRVQRIQPKEIITTLASRAAVPSEVVVTEVPECLAVSREWSTLVAAAEVEQFSPREAIAGSMLLKYIASNLQETEFSMAVPQRWRDSEVMLLDSNALHSLEIRRSMREQGLRGSLLHTMKRTITHSGTRLLSDWLISPSTSIHVINKRLDLVALLLEHDVLQQEVTRFLRNSGDAARVLQRFGFGRGEVEDLLTISRAITATSDLLNLLLRYENVAHLTCRMNVLTALQRKITKSIDETGLRQRDRDRAESAAAIMDDVLAAMSGPSRPIERRRKAIERDMCHTMAPTASPRLRLLHDSLAAMMLEQDALATRLKTESGIPSLTLKTLPGLSHIVHIKGKTDGMHKIAGARAVASTRSTTSLHVPEWSHLGTQIESVKMQIQQEETRTFHTLRRDVLQHAAPLRDNARILDELDVARCFAVLARERSWTRPRMTTENVTRIEGGRHPVVEAALLLRGQRFTRNALTFSADTRIHIVTGTNMGGKSTFLRQTAIIQVLAQCGCFVPATSAVLGIKDAVFSRLGSNDDLFHGDSTFMLEMKECAGVLRHATRNSLVLMDEVGRGTTATDGTSIAYACLSALSKAGASVLFATHFHALADLVTWRGVGHLYTDIVEHGDGAFHFSHDIRRGVCRDSHGLKVATIAGIPAHVIDEAKSMQQKLIARQSRGWN